IFYADRPVHDLTVRVTGEAEVQEMAGLVRGAPEPLPVGVFLRPTPLTEPDAALAEWAQTMSPGEPLERLHQLMAELNERLRFDAGATGVETGAAEAYRAGHGVCQD